MSVAAEIGKRYIFTGMRPAHSMRIVLAGLVKKGFIVKTRTHQGNIPAGYRLKQKKV